MGSIDFTAVVFGASFVAFIFLMNLFFFSPMEKFFKKRENLIDGNQKKAKELITDFEGKVESYEEKLAEARSKASEILASAIEESKVKKESIVNEALKEIEASRNSALVEIESNRKDLVAELSGTIREISALMTEKILEQNYKLDISEEKIKSVLDDGNGKVEALA